MKIYAHRGLTSHDPIRQWKDRPLQPGMTGSPRVLYRVRCDVFFRGFAVCDVGVEAKMVAAAADMQS